VPVFIFLGLGTLGTEVTGYFFTKSFIELGKLYANKPFCILLQANSNKGRTYYDIKAAYPKPITYRMLLYPFTFYKWYKKSVFPKN
jgi:hypothetical protein